MGGPVKRPERSPLVVYTFSFLYSARAVVEQQIKEGAHTLKSQTKRFDRLYVTCETMRAALVACTMAFFVSAGGLRCVSVDDLQHGHGQKKAAKAKKSAEKAAAFNPGDRVSFTLNGATVDAKVVGDVRAGKVEIEVLGRHVRNTSRMMRQGA